jgi:serine/threonine-protein kinase
VDKRADIWAFGVVLYEMLTGKTVFQGEDVSVTLASVITSDANLTLLPSNIHPRVREVVKRCLQKEPKKRYSGISDAQYEIEQVLSDPSGIFAQPISTVEPRRNLRSTLTLITAAVILIAIIVGAFIWNFRTSEPRRVIRLDYDLPENQQFSVGIFTALAVSPDSTQFVYSTTEGLFLRSENELEARFIVGTDEDPVSPFFSPDGQWIGYFSTAGQATKLKKIVVSGGAAVTLCEVSGTPVGASWDAFDMIVYGQYPTGEIMRISANGGTPELLVKAEGALYDPQMLPDGNTLLFSHSSSGVPQVVVQSLETGERKELFPGHSARYLPTGHIIYAVGNNLLAVPFNLDRLEVLSGGVPVVEGVLLNQGNIWSNYAISDSGTLVYIPGTSTSTSLRTLVWVDREGKEEQIDAEPNIYSFPKISPNGNQVALSIEDPGNQNQEIFIWDEVRKILNKRTFDKSTDKLVPIWTPDGERIVYFSNHDSTTGGIYWRPANGTGEAEKLVSNSDRRLIPYSFSNDGKILVMHEFVTTSNLDISILSMEDDGERKLLLQTEFNESQPKISPDNQYIAYVCDESDQKEIYVRPLLNEKKGKWQISQGGGTSPLWSPDGKELFYLGLDNSVIAVDVEIKPIFEPGTPKILFQSKYVGFIYGEGTPWDIHPKGDRFIMIKPPPGATATVATGPRKINIVVNWFEELKQRVPVD